MEWITNHGQFAARIMSARISKTLLLYVNTHTQIPKSHICAHQVYCVAHCRGFFFVIEETVKATLWNEIINCLLLKHMNAHTRARTSQWQIWNVVIALKMPSKHNCWYCCIFFSSQNALLCMLTNINEEKKDEKKNAAYNVMKNCVYTFM